jgi:hypothetical protein
MVENNYLELITLDIKSNRLLEEEDRVNVFNNKFDRKVYSAYLNAKELNHEFLIITCDNLYFGNSIGFIDYLKKIGITEFIFDSNSSAAMQLLIQFMNDGCEIVEPKTFVQRLSFMGDERIEETGLLIRIK